MRKFNKTVLINKILLINKTVLFLKFVKKCNKDVFFILSRHDDKCNAEGRLKILYFVNADYRISSLIRRSFFLPNNPKNLDPSSKTDLDLWDCLGRIKLVLQQNCTGLI